MFVLVVQSEASSILGKDLDQTKQHKMISIFVRYSQAKIPVILDNTEKFDTQLMDFGVYGEYAYYSRLYMGLGAHITAAKIDNKQYGNEVLTVYGGGIDLGFTHKTFFGNRKSYDLGLRLSLLATDAFKVTDSSGDKQEDFGGLGFLYVEPYIGISYGHFGIALGYAYKIHDNGTVPMPTLTAKYMF